MIGRERSTAGQGVGAPIENRVAHGEDAMIWRSVTSGNVEDSALLEADFAPLPHEAYGGSRPDEKSEVRKNNRYP